MTAPTTQRRDALAPLREALLAAARADAERVLAAADADADAADAQARADAEAMRAAARARGAADAEALLAVAQGSARREARAVVLDAQRHALEDLRARARQAVRDLRNDPGYPAVREALADRARARLGDAALVQDASVGGVVATAGTRRVAFTLDGLADELVDRLGPDVEGLWRP